MFGLVATALGTTPTLYAAGTQPCFANPHRQRTSWRQNSERGRDRAGNLNYVGQEEGFDLIKDLPVWDVIERKMRVVGDLSR